MNRLHQGPPNPQRVPPPDEWLAELATVPLLHQPGRGWTYNTGSDILGVLLARAVDRPLPDLLAERVSSRWAWSTPASSCPPASVGRLPSYYAADPGPGRSPCSTARTGSGRARRPSRPGPAAWCRTVDDWFRFARLLLDDGVVGGRRLLRPESIEQMTTDHIGDRDRGPGGDVFLDGQGWGFGGGVDMHVTEPWQRPGRYGWVGGTGTSAYLHRPSRSVRIFLSQVQLGGPTSVDAMKAFWRATAPRADRAGRQRPGSCGCGTRRAPGARAWSAGRRRGPGGAPAAATPAAGPGCGRGSRSTASAAPTRRWITRTTSSDPGDVVHPGPHLVAGVHRGGRLGRLAVDPHVPAPAGRGGVRPGLGQPDRPQPAVQSGRVHRRR